MRGGKSGSAAAAWMRGPVFAKAMHTPPREATPSRFTVVWLASGEEACTVQAGAPSHSRRAQHDAQRCATRCEDG